MTAREIADVFESIAPLDSGVPGDELGFVYGDPDLVITGVGCTWCVHEPSIRRCAVEQLNLLICHERLWLPPQQSPWYEPPPESRLYAARLRGGMLDEHGMTVYRSHSNWDALPVHGVADSAVAALGIEGLTTVDRQKYFSICELPEAWSIRTLAEHVGNALEFDRCRTYGKEERQIRRFAFLIGGFGENQYHMPQAAWEMGAEAIIIGEMSEFIVIASLEMGMPVIETLHSVSEIPGIKAQAALLAERLPNIPVRYVASGAARVR